MMRDWIRYGARERHGGGADAVRSALIAGVAALVLGTIAAAVAAAFDYTLAHNDARARLVVARRVFDSLTPGLSQMGGIWLPLPHVINIPLVQVDALYRTGLGTVAVNVIAFAAIAASTAGLVTTITGRALAGLAAAGFVVLHPDLLFLQATPMTEPLTLGLIAGAVALLIIPARPSSDAEVRGTAARGESPASHRDRRGALWARRDDREYRAYLREEQRRPRGCIAGRMQPDFHHELTGLGRPWMAASLLALAVLTRYEAWPVAAAVAACALFAHGWPAAGNRAWHRHPAVAVVLLVAVALVVAACWSRVTTGSWLVTSGFYQPKDTAQQPLHALGTVLVVMARAAGPGVLILAAVGLFWLVWQAGRDPARRLHLLAGAPLAAGLLFWYAANAGHPILARYAVFLVVPLIWLGAVGAGRLRDIGRPIAFVALVALVVVSGGWYVRLWMYPPAILEAASDVREREARRPAVAALVRDDASEMVLASMWSTAPVLHEARDLPLRRVVHEGNRRAWREALAAPAEHVDWILFACHGSTNDRLFRDLVRSPELIADFELVGHGGGLEVYRRRSTPASVADRGPSRPPCWSGLR